MRPRHHHRSPGAKTCQGGRYAGNAPSTLDQKGDPMSSKRRRKKKSRRNHAANHGKRPQC
ncbi:hypothetical protein CG747_34460 [Streptomyces sp. CB02959]|nr:hypothetical protein CG747_34460 [Streptomyces sp. CB02959]